MTDITQAHNMHFELNVKLSLLGWAVTDRRRRAMANKLTEGSWAYPQVILATQAIAGNSLLPHCRPSCLKLYVQVSGGPSARGGHACAAIGQDVYMFGGASREPQAYNDLWRLRRSIVFRKDALVNDAATIRPKQIILLCPGSENGTSAASWEWEKVAVLSRSDSCPALPHGHVMNIV